jgi:hypothetical protein
MTNLLNELLIKFPQLKGFKVTEAFIEFGELYMTSEYDIPMELYNECEDFATS